MLGSEDTFHQKLTVPGPVTVVCIEPEVPSATGPLRAASTPSWLTINWPTHGAELLVVHTQAGVSSASARKINGVTLSSASELVTLPAEPVTTTE